MMSLMESAQRQSQAERSGIRVMEGEEKHRNNISSLSQEEDHDFDENKEDNLKAGVDAVTSPLGTYAIVKKAGLTALPHHLDVGENGKQNENFDAPDDPENDKSPIQFHSFQVHHGQLLQVVDVKDNVAKLAWRRGFVVASSTQLVKR
mmetsp:Transcript_16941/g.25130  ORF Transcript_16941/g.25130 Transcript_16941/m.25130 type:complete len:148 (-) Transcript_16941:1063-1506(-)